MPDYSHHLNLLSFSLLIMLALFIVSYAAGWDQLAIGTMVALVVNVGTILILSRFGGDLGGTD